MRVRSTENRLKSSARTGDNPHWGAWRWWGWQLEDGGAGARQRGRHSSSGSLEEQGAFDRRQQEKSLAGGNSEMWQVWNAGKGGVSAVPWLQRPELVTLHPF